MFAAAVLLIYCGFAVLLRCWYFDAAFAAALAAAFVAALLPLMQLSAFAAWPHDRITALSWTSAGALCGGEDFSWTAHPLHRSLIGSRTTGAHR